MMMVLGIALFGTTVLLPQFIQIMMGYTAQQAGMALSPGGLTVMLLMPLVGTLIGRVDARKMVAFGFLVLSLSLFYMSHTIYHGHGLRRGRQAARLSSPWGSRSCSCPSTRWSYVGMPPEKNNAISGIVNLSRNMGGDIGIAMVTTLLARRSQYHQAALGAYADPYHSAYDSRIRGVAAGLEVRGVPHADAVHKAMATVYRGLQQQAMVLSYTDVVFLMGCGTMCMLPLLLLLKKNTPGKVAMGH